MYTQHQARFEEIGELMLGIRLVEMVHYDKLGDFLLKASDVMDTDIPGNNQLTVHPIIDLGTSAESALRLSLQAEKETLEEYYKVFDSLNRKEEYIKRSDYIPVTYLIQKFIADEEYHISLLKKALKEYEDSDDEPKKCKSVTVINMKIIIRNCNVAELDIPLKYAIKLYNEFAIRHPNAFYLRTRQRGMQNWDGKIKYITKTGQFKIGLLPSVYKRCIELGIKPIVVDMRQPLPKVSKVVTQIGKYKLRPEQEKAVKAILSNKLGETPFQIGVLDYTVNAGKTLIMSALYLSYKKQLKTLLITNDSDWLNQARDEFKQYLPGEDITFVQGKVLNWSNFTIGMVQSISRNMKYYQNELAKIDMVLIDEADQGGSKQYQNVITRLFNTRVRIGLSGTIYMSKLAKDKVKNMNLRCFFGDVIAEFKLKDSIKKGYSTKTIVKTVEGKPWFGNWESDCMSYNEIYDDSITHNKIAWTMALDRLKWNLNQGRYPALVVCKHIAHCENLCKFFKKKLDNKYNIACVHVNTPTKLRQQIMKDFREGKIDILVSTTIIARGKNFPKLRYLLNTASMDSQEKSIQFLGRLVRKDESKSKVYLDDLHYPGNYLSRHGNHRRKYYQDQGLKVIRLSKLWDKYPRHKPFQG